MSDERCDYDTGPCKFMRENSRSVNEEPKAGIVAINNRLNLDSPPGAPTFHHMGFALRGPGVREDYKTRGLLLSYCPWCGAELFGDSGRSWYERYSHALHGTEPTPWAKAVAAAGDNPVLRAYANASLLESAR